MRKQGFITKQNIGQALDKTEEDKRTIARIKDKANERSVYAEDQKAIAEDAPAFLPGGRWSREAEFDRDLAETAAANEVTGPRGADVDQENNDNDSRNPGNTGPGGTGRDGGGRTGDPGDRPGSDRGV